MYRSAKCISEIGLAAMSIISAFPLGYYFFSIDHIAYAVSHTLPQPSSEGPTIVNNDTHLKIENVFTGLKSPTSMAF